DRVVGGAFDHVGAPVVDALGAVRDFARFVAFDRLEADQGAAAVFVAHLPVGGVAAEGGDVDAGVAGGLVPVHLVFRPVLVVAGDNQRLVVEQLAGVGVDRRVVGVGDVIALALEPLDHRQVGFEEPVGFVEDVEVRAFEGDPHRFAGAGDGEEAGGVEAV